MRISAKPSDNERPHHSLIFIPVYYILIFHSMFDFTYMQYNTICKLYLGIEFG